MEVNKTMRFKKFFIIICLIMVLFTVASVNAGDVSKDIVASVDASDVSDDVVASVDAGDVSDDVVASVDASDVSDDVVASVDAGDVSDDVVVASDDTQNENISVSDNENILTFDHRAMTILQDHLNKCIDDPTWNTFNMATDYSYNSEEDSALIGGITIAGSVTIEGNGHKIDGRGKMRIFQITNGATVIIKNMTFVNGWTDKYGYGGAIWNNGANVTVINCHFINNTAYDGGALSNVKAENCTFVNNFGVYRGGAIYSGSAVNCSFVYNNAIYGGAIFESFVQNCSFINNRAEQGGAICYIDNNDSIINCSFVNSTANFGGAIYFKNKCTVTNSSFVNNRAKSYGGAVYFETEGSAIPDCFVQNCSFANNFAKEGGGAIYKIYAQNCSFINNRANQGGAMLYGSAQNCSFINNRANQGGAMQNGSAQSCSFINNSADVGGAMLYSSAQNCSFVNNTARLGGAMYSVSAVNCSFINNTGTRGGAIYLGSTQNCSFINNKAYQGGASYATAAVNCSFVNNDADKEGRAMYLGSAQNCSFVNNDAIQTKIEFYNVNDLVYRGESVIFTGLPECNILVTATDKNNNSKTFTCTDKGWQVKDLDPGKYAVKFTISYNEIYGELITQIEVKFKPIQELETLIQNTQNETILLNNDYYCYEEGSLKNGIMINKSITIDGQGYRIDADKLMRIFQITNNATATFKNIVFLNGNAGANGYGGAIWNNGAKSVTAINCTFENNTANYGGALTSANAVNCTFKSNYGSQDTSIGGAMYEGTATNCIFTGNYVKQYGGAMYNATAINCTFTGNNAIRIGGAMDYGTATNCTFIDNTASLGQSMMQGTAINCTFVNNNIYQSLIKFYITNEQPEAGNNVSFTGLPECNLIVNVTNKDGESKTFDCTNEGWNMRSLEPGTYTIRFIIKDNKSNSGEFETQITVPDVLGLNVNVEDIFEGENAIINITANPNFTGDVSLSLNGTTFNVKVNNGIGNYQFTDLEVGNYKVTVSFKGHDEFNPSEKSVSFEVKPKYDLNLNVNANDINEGNMATVTVTTNDAFDGMVKISINGTEIQNETIEIIEGKGSFIAMDLAAENYTVTVCFDGNIAFNAETKSVGFEVKKEDDKTDLNLTVSVEDIFAGQNATVKVTTNNTFNGKVILIINGIVSDNIIINDGEGSYTVENLSVGNYTAYVGFNGDDTFDTDAKSKSFEVKPKIDLDLNINVSDIFEGQDAVVNITSNNTFTGNVTLSVNGTDYTVKVINGVGNYTISGLPAGNHIVTVSFKGSDKFSPTEKTAKFEVKAKYNLNLNVNASDIFEGQDAVVNITTDNNFTGEVILSINGRNITVNVVNGVGNYAIQDLSADNYTATVSFKGNYKFNPTQKSVKFEVKPKYNIGLNVNVEDINEGNMATVTVTTNDAFDGTVKISINGTDIQNETLEIIEGKGSFIAMDLAAENYTVTVRFDGNTAFNAETKSTEFKVKKEADKTDLNLTISVEDIYVGQYACVNVTTDDSFIGELIIVINGIVNDNVVVLFGEGEYYIEDLPVGNYVAYIGFNGDDTFKSAAKSVAFEVKPKQDLNLTVSVDDIFEGQNATVKITADKEFTGNVSIFINWENVLVSVINGTGSHIISGLSIGNYTANVNFEGNYKFNYTEKSVEFEVKPKYDLDLNVNANDINEGNMATITVTTNNIFNGEVKISINGTDIQNETLEIIEGKGSFIAMDLAAENYTVTVRFDGNTAFNAETKSTEFKVKKEADKTDLNLTISVEDIYVGQYACVNVTTDDSFIGELIIVINGIVNDNVVVLFGEGEYYIEDLPVGNYVAYIGFNGDDTFKSAAKSVAFEVKPKQDLNLTVSVDDIFEGQNATVKITADKEFTGNVSIFINWENVIVSVINGTGSHIISGLSIGNYTADVNFEGNYKFNFTEKSVKFEVKPKAEPPAIDVNVPADAETPEFTIKLPSDATGTLKVTVNGKTYTANLVNGSATITVQGLADGTYDAVISYSGDAKYPAVTKNTTLTVKNPVYKIINNKDVAMLYTSKSLYKVLVTKNGKAVGAGEAVAIKFNGKTYTVKTDKNGYATLKLPNVKPKKAKYVITATYKGITVKNTVKVNSIIKAANKKVKKSKKVTKVKVTLKKVNGKYLKSKTLKIKFKGKTYKVKTNKKGVATWKVKKSMLKKLKVGKKYKYKVTYGKDVVTKKLTIKR